LSTQKIFCILSILAILFLPVRGFPARETEAADSGGSRFRPVGRSQGRGMGGYFRDGAALDLEARWSIIEKKLQPFFGSIVDTLIVSGNTRSRRITIIREMATKQGESLDEGLIRRDSSYLRGLGYFSDVHISAEKTIPGRCRVYVHVLERPDLFMKYPYPVVNYDFNKGLSYGLTWKVKNFRGVGEELAFSALKRRDKDHGGSFSWTIPWFGGRRMLMHYRLSTFRRLEEPVSDDFIKEQNRVDVVFGLPLSKSLVRQVWFTTTLSFEGRDSRQRLNGNSCFYRQNFLAAGFGLRYDSRDNRITPWRGTFSRIVVKRFTSVHGLEQQYIFYNLSQYLYLPIGSVGTIILAADGIVREGDLPSFYEMGLGGSSDLRGFVNGDLEGKAKILSTVQWRRRIYGPRIFNIPYIGKFDLSLNLIAFIDNGSLMDCIDEVREAKFYTTGGAGIEVVSPIQDLMRIEVAGDEDGDLVFYFTSGSRF